MSANSSERQRVAKVFGRILRAARKQRGLTQEELAREANMDRTYPSLLERGLRTPTLTVIVELAQVLRVEPSEMVADTVKCLKGAP